MLSFKIQQAMKRKIGLIILLLSVPFSVLAQNATDNETTKVNRLIGNWTIDLRPAPDAEAYFQTFKVTSIDGNTFNGSFYGSEIKNALINNNWPKLYFAFATSDESNDYYHSGYMENGKLYGISYCPNREFTAPWIGTKK
ncbi:MAG: hypothetical protein BM564_01160 [Bacteroidetes bacterium MedPE-SWsnd-G2]|nr:MAG: hypothetical protein BM564_01160 [Bacteroidetes bacterium MedPE-SWsnd-G2]